MRKLRRLVNEFSLRYKSWKCPMTPYLLEGHEWEHFSYILGRPLDCDFQWRAWSRICKKCNTRNTLDIQKEPLGI